MANWIWIEWKTGRGNFLTQMIGPFCSFIIDVYLYCVQCEGFPNVVRFPVTACWHISPNIHCFCTAGARAIFWFLLITDQWNYVKHVSCVLVFLPFGLVLCRFVCPKNVVWDRDAAPPCQQENTSKIRAFCLISSIVVIIAHQFVEIDLV